MIFSRTDDYVIGSTMPAAMGVLRTSAGSMAGKIDRRLFQHVMRLPPDDVARELRSLVRQRAIARHGLGMDPVNDAVELESLYAMRADYRLLAEVLPTRGGIVQLPTWDHVHALGWLLSDLQDVQVLKLARHLSRNPHDNESAAFEHRIRVLGNTIDACYATAEADEVPLPPALAEELASLPVAD